MGARHEDTVVRVDLRTCFERSAAPHERGAHQRVGVFREFRVCLLLQDLVQSCVHGEGRDVCVYYCST